MLRAWISSVDAHCRIWDPIFMALTAGLVSQTIDLIFNGKVKMLLYSKVHALLFEVTAGFIAMPPQF